MAALTAASTAFFSVGDKLERLSTYVIDGSAGLYFSVCSLYLITKGIFEETRPLTSQARIVRVNSGLLPFGSPVVFISLGTVPDTLTRNGLSDVALPGSLEIASENVNHGIPSMLLAGPLLPRLLNSILVTCPLSSVISISNSNSSPR